MRKIKLLAIPVLLLCMISNVACNLKIYDSENVSESEIESESASESVSKSELESDSVLISPISYDLTNDYNNPELIDTFADLTNEEKAMFKYMKGEVWKRSEYIDLSAYNVKLSNFYDTDNLPWYSAADVFFQFRTANLDLPFLNEVAEYEYFEKDECTYLKALKVKYLDIDMDAFFEAKNDALSLLSNDMTDYEKYLTIHDYIVSRTIYDLDEAWPWYDDCAYGPLVVHKSTCAGYARAFKYLCNCAGLPCYIMDKSEICHQWNVVIVDNEPYYVDSTWDDDSVPSILSSAHTNFLLNEEECKTTHGEWYYVYNYGKDLELKCTSTKYKNAFWRDATSQIAKYKGYYYYSAKDYSRNEANVIYRTPVNDLTKKEEVAVNPGEYPNIKDYTPGFPIINSKYVTIKGNRLWINDGKGIISMKTDGTDVKREYLVLKEDWYFGEAYDSNGEIYYVMYDPNNSKNYSVGLLTDEYKVSRK